MSIDAQASAPDSAAAHNDPAVFLFDSISVPFNPAFVCTQLPMAAAAHLPNTIGTS
jgi:hypothetical protein